MWDGRRTGPVNDQVMNCLFNLEEGSCSFNGRSGDAAARSKRIKTNVADIVHKKMSYSCLGSSNSAHHSRIVLDIVDFVQPHCKSRTLIYLSLEPSTNTNANTFVSSQEYPRHSSELDQVHKTIYSSFDDLYNQVEEQFI